MKPNLINELLALEAFAEELRQRCYRVRRKLEGVYPPATSAPKKKALTDADVHHLLAARKKAVLKNINK